MVEQPLSLRYKGITIWVEQMAEMQYDGVFRWNNRVIRTDPSYAYALSPAQAIEEAKDVIDTLLQLRREGIFVAEDDGSRHDWQG